MNMFIINMFYALHTLPGFMLLVIVLITPLIILRSVLPSHCQTHANVYILTHKINLNICFTHEYCVMHIREKSQLKVCLPVLGGEMSQCIMITLLCRFLCSRTIVNFDSLGTCRSIKKLYISLYVM